VGWFNNARIRAMAEGRVPGTLMVISACG